MLSEYQDMNVPEYLDARYFNRVMRSVDPFAVVHTPLIVRVHEQSTVFENCDAFLNNFAHTAKVMYARVVVEKVTSSGEITIRHSQLLIIDHNQVIHFESDHDVYEDVDFYNTITDIVSRTFPEHEIKQKVLVKSGVKDINESERDYLDIPGGMCVAYVLKYAYFHALGQEIEFGDLEDIRMFARTVQYLYGPLTEGVPEVEFGTNALIGGLAGAGLGYAVGGTSGALLGGAGGLLLGSYLGGGRDRGYGRRYDRGYGRRYDRRRSRSRSRSRRGYY